MIFLIFIFGILLALGLFFIISDLLKLPRLATQKAMQLAGREGKQKSKNIDILLLGWAVKLSKYIPIDEYKKARMRNTLNASGLATSRLLPALLEQNQLKDGTVVIPEVLRKYMNCKEIIEPKNKVLTKKYR